MSLEEGADASHVPVLFVNQGSVIIPLEDVQHHNQGLFLQLFGVAPIDSLVEHNEIEMPQQEEAPPESFPVEEPLVEARGVRRYLPDDEEEQGSSKRPRLEEAPPTYDPLHVMTRTGEIIHLDQGEPTNILLNERAEPNILIRKIISKMPWKGLVSRMDYLYKFTKTIETVFVQEDENHKQRYDEMRDNVLAAYMKECKLRTAFKKLLTRWRIRRMDKTGEDEVDPITLCPPDKPVILYDWNYKRKFVFEANTLALLIESKLLYHENGFPMPMYPKSPRNNVEFSYQQLVSIYYQLQSHGELLWGLTTLRQSNFNKKRWYKYHKSAVTIAAIKNSISLLDTRDGIELLSDFIFAKMEELRFHVTRYVTDVYLDAMARVPNHWYLEKWKYIAMVHYEGEHFGEDRTRYVNACSFKLFRKQNQFFHELKMANIVR